jgi:hypothetical protein
MPFVFEAYQGFITFGAVRDGAPSDSNGPTEYQLMTLEISAVANDGDLAQASMGNWYPRLLPETWPITGNFDVASGSISFELSTIAETLSFEGYVCQFDLWWEPAEVILAGTYQRFVHVENYPFETFNGAWYCWGLNGGGLF